MFYKRGDVLSDQFEHLNWGGNHLQELLNIFHNICYPIPPNTAKRLKLSEINEKLQSNFWLVISTHTHTLNLCAGKERDEGKSGVVGIRPI